MVAIEAGPKQPGTQKYCHEHKSATLPAGPEHAHGSDNSYEQRRIVPLQDDADSTDQQH